MLITVCSCFENEEPVQQISAFPSSLVVQADGEIISQARVAGNAGVDDETMEIDNSLSRLGLRSWPYFVLVLLGDVGVGFVWFWGVRGELEYRGEDELLLELAPALLLSPDRLGMAMEEDMIASLVGREGWPGVSRAVAVVEYFCSSVGIVDVSVEFRLTPSSKLRWSLLLQCDSPVSDPAL